MKFVPYLFFDGDCREAFEFYAGLFGGEIRSMMPHRGTPAADFVPPEWQDKILNAQLVIGDQELMASDAPPAHSEPRGGYSISVQIDDQEKAARIFAALAEGGSVSMPFEPTFWAKRFGMLKDRFGTAWMINCGEP